MSEDTGAHPRIRSYVLRAGRVGSGQARGNELHFEIRRNERPADPAGVLPQRR